MGKMLDITELLFTHNSHRPLLAFSVWQKKDRCNDPAWPWPIHYITRTPTPRRTLLVTANSGVLHSPVIGAGSLLVFLPSIKKSVKRVRKEMMQQEHISEMLKFRFGSKVFCSDGEYGILEAVIVDPAQRKVTHVGVTRGILLKKRSYAPFSAVEAASSDGVTLTMSSEALVSQDTAPTGGIALSARSLVVVPGSGKGTLLLVAVQPLSGTLTYVVAHQLAAGQDTLLNAAYISEVSSEGIVLNITAETLKGLPPYRSDRELQREVEAALFDLYPLHIDMRGIKARVLDGVLYLDGNISSALRADLVERQVMSVPGLLEIKNNLVADDTLAGEVALALSRDPRTHGLPIGVYPRLGIVRLSGAVRTAEQKRAANEIVRSIPGVREVIDDLAIDPKAAHLPIMASTGAEDEDLVPGGRYVRHTR
jgi:osmotically-inducible protein OsmY